MKKHPRRKFWAAVLLFCLFPPFAAPQTAEEPSAEEPRTETPQVETPQTEEPPQTEEARTEEWIERGRFGAEDIEAPEAGKDSGDYHKHWLYLAARAGPSLRMYTPVDDTPYTGGDAFGFALDMAVQAAVQILPFLSVQGELIFTWDRASRWDYFHTVSGEQERYTWDYNSFSLMFPLMAKLNFYPGKFRVSPFIGLYFLVPLGDIQISESLTNEKSTSSYRYSPPLGLLGGISGAMKLGPGMIFADLRYAADLGEVEPAGGDIKTYLRSMGSLTFGYEWAFFTKDSATKNSTTKDSATKKGGGHE
ncbi:MAG: hypothetical protein LBR93_10940 [Treponema sp.]|jgi:hypothetical protein|nr:hypothetical protein [Treponema sp.]